VSTLELVSTPDEDDSSVSLRRRLRRLALDVHDGPMQSLIAAGFGLSDLKRHADDHLAVRLAEIASELAGAERSLRELISTLEQTGKEELDSVEEIVGAEVRRFTSRCAAAVAVVVRGDAVPDSHSQEIAIRSVLREALTNVAKHANASAVRVEVEADAAGIRLEVEDDGDGFDPAAVGADRIGLTSMRERLHFLGGSLAIASGPGGPTVVTATLRRWRRA
jgi:signal transduction histidine kinase